MKAGSANLAYAAAAAALLLWAAAARSSEEAKAVLGADELELNGKTFKLSKEKDPAKLGKALRAAAGDAPKSKDAALVIEAGEKAPWSALQKILLASFAAGIGKVRVQAGEAALELNLPGSDSENGEVLDLPLLPGKGEALQTENEGKKLACDAALLKDLVKQAPKSVVNLQAAEGVGARSVVNVILILQAAKAAGIAYLPGKEVHALKAVPSGKSGDEHESGAERMAHSLSE
ncbi:MAG: hypothetical protein HY291_10245 [Planctomycetes bacterium]|nr:hypothetical protein [Planctomycetota bacterium]